MTMGVREVAVAIKGAMRDVCDAGNVLCLDGTNVNIPDLIFYSGFTRCYYWGQLGEGYTRFLCIISYNCM